MNDRFISRDLRPACKTQTNNVIFSSRFTSPPISEHLKTFYAPQRGIDLPRLEGGQNVGRVFEHLPCPLETLVESVNILPFDGVVHVRISAPDGWNIKKRIRPANSFAPRQSPLDLSPVAPLEHINCICHTALLSMISCAERLKPQLRSLYYLWRCTPDITLHFIKAPVTP